MAEDGRPSMREVLDALRGGLAGSLPPDPFPADFTAGVALNEMLTTMTGAGMPLGSAERILGAMLAAYGIMSEEDRHAES